MTTFITPCMNAGKYPACNKCRRANPSHEDKKKMAGLWSAHWSPDEWDTDCCPGLLHIDAMLTETTDIGVRSNG